MEILLEQLHLILMAVLVVKTKHLAVDTLGNVYLAGMHDNNKFIKISAAGSTCSGYDSCLNYYDQDWPHGANSSTFQNIRDVEIDNSGNVYVLDEFQVSKYTSSGDLMCTTNLESNHDYNVISPDNSENFYLLQWNINKKYDSSCNFISNAGNSGLSDGQIENPVDAKFDNSGNFYHFGSGEPSKRIQKFTNFPSTSIEPFTIKLF